MAAVIDWDGKLIAKPEVHLRGVVTSVSRADLLSKVQDTIEVVLRDRWSEFARLFGDKLDVDRVGLQTQIERELVRMLRRELQSNPLLVF